VRFQELLSNFRFKRVTSDDVKLLETRLCKNISAEEKTKFDTATRVYSINKKVDLYNRENIASLNIPILKVTQHQSPPNPFLIPEFVFLGNTFECFLLVILQSFVCPDNIFYLVQH
jgi:vacuolar-type H+-ATPase subunit D/Vma8